MQFLDADGNPLVGGKVYTYAAGTSTPLATYTDYGGATPNANPVILNSRGEASIWFGTAAYKLELYTAANVLIWTADNVSASTPVVYGTGVAAALAINVGTAGSILVNGGVLGTPSSGLVTNLTGTASININGTVGATTANTGAFTTISASGTATMAAINASGVITASSGASASALVGDSTNAGGTALNLKNSGTTKTLLGGWNAIIGSGSANDTVLSAAGQLGLYSSSTQALVANGSAVTIPGTLAVAGVQTLGSLGVVNAITNSGNSYRINIDSTNIGSGNSFEVAANTAAASGGTSLLVVAETGAVTIPGTLGVTGAITAGGMTVLGNLIANYTGTPADSASAYLYVQKYANDSTTANIFAKFTINATVTGSGQINANGASAAAFGSFSDSRLKDNITNLPPQLANILALRPVEFDYKDGSGHQLGFIAQEVQEIYPDLVGVGEGGMLTLTDMNKNDARLIKAIQELATDFEAYKSSHP